MEKYYPAAVHQKAEKMECLLLRLEAGEKLEPVKAELGLKITAEQVEKLKSKYEAGGRKRAALLDGRHGHHQHVNSEVRAYLYERKQADKELTAGKLVEEVAQKYQIKVSEGHINYILREVALTRPQGRPRKERGQPQEEKREAPQANAGLFFPGGGQTRAGRDQNHRKEPE